MSYQHMTMTLSYVDKTNWATVSLYGYRPNILKACSVFSNRDKNKFSGFKYVTTKRHVHGGNYKEKTIEQSGVCKGSPMEG